MRFADRYFRNRYINRRGRIYSLWHAVPAELIGWVVVLAIIILLVYPY